jgi:hypothetical protein
MSYFKALIYSKNAAKASGKRSEYGYDKKEVSNQTENRKAEQDRSDDAQLSS